VRAADIDRDCLPKILRKAPIYFRGVPYEALEAAGILVV